MQNQADFAAIAERLLLDLEKLEKDGGADPLEIAKAHAALASALHEAGALEEAVDFFLQAWGEFRSLRGPHDFDTLAIAHALACSFLHTDSPTEAVHVITDALQDLCAAPGHFSQALCYDFLGVALEAALLDEAKVRPLLWILEASIDTAIQRIRAAGTLDRGSAAVLERMAQVLLRCSRAEDVVDAELGEHAFRRRSKASELVRVAEELLLAPAPKATAQAAAAAADDAVDGGDALSHVLDLLRAEAQILDRSDSKSLRGQQLETKFQPDGLPEQFPQGKQPQVPLQQSWQKALQMLEKDLSTDAGAHGNKGLMPEFGVRNHAPHPKFQFRPTAVGAAGCSGSPRGGWQQALLTLERALHLGTDD